MLIKEKVRVNSNISGGTVNFKFSLSSNDNFIGYQQEIDSLTQVTALDLVNPVVDVETRRFKLISTPTSTIPLQFKFSSTPPTSPLSFVAAGFTQNEINENTLNLLNSFFIMDFYDTYDTNNQTKIFRTYLTKIKEQYPAPVYIINPNNQLYYWYVPISYMTGTTRIGYVKFSFFNAKFGTTTLFYNEDNISLTTPERLFFMVELNNTYKTWRFISPYNIIKATEIINNTLYINKVNDTYTKFNNLAQAYPSGNTYNYINNNYIT